MNGHEHILKVEELLDFAREIERGDENESSLLLEAQVHATLAVAYFLGEAVQHLVYPMRYVELADPADDLRAEQASDARRDQHDEDGAR